MPAGVSLGTAGKKALAALKSLTFSMPTWKTVGADLATVRAQSSSLDGKTHTWTVTLISSNGVWKIASTTPIVRHR